MWSRSRGCTIQRISPGRTEGEEHGPCLPSRPCVTLSITLESSPVRLPPWLGCVYLAQTQLGWPAPCSRPLHNFKLSIPDRRMRLCAFSLPALPASLVVGSLTTSSDKITRFQAVTP